MTTCLLVTLKNCNQLGQGWTISLYNVIGATLCTPSPYDALKCTDVVKCPSVHVAVAVLLPSGAAQTLFFS